MATINGTNQRINPGYGQGDRAGQDRLNLNPKYFDEKLANYQNKQANGDNSSDQEFQRLLKIQTLGRLLS